MIPVTSTAPNRMPKSSGIRLEFVTERLEMTNISVQMGLANVGTEEARLVSFGAPETSFPLEMLALIASLSESLGGILVGTLLLQPFASLCFWFLVTCHDLWNSTKLLVPPINSTLEMPQFYVTEQLRAQKNI
jgi:hypothetical protein